MYLVQLVAKGTPGHYSSWLGGASCPYRTTDYQASDGQWLGLSLSLQLIVAGLALVFSVLCICDHQIQPYLGCLRILHPRGVRFYRPSIRTSPIRHDLVCFVPPTSPQRVSILVGCGQTLDDAIYSLVLITARLP